ncbi:MAG: hypothetical protein GXP37_14075 [Chloroflexi bacterium]|nr:hypothetical protein [Chloroflexota bacterium]
MFRSRLIKGAIALLMMFVIGFFGAWIVQASSGTTADPAAVVQSSGNDTLVGITSPSSASWVNCTANSVAVFSNRIHVRCTQSYSGIRYFAYPTTDAASVARFLSILTSAQVSGHLLQVLYDPADHSGTSYSCASNDCRPIQAVALY